ncbi:hypothetical protein IU428_30230, partial [Nocardia abscessus]|nr:hypothetical protein [Nocardia abscessus]
MSDDDISAHRPRPGDRLDGPPLRRAPVAPWERNPAPPDAENPDVNAGVYDDGQAPRVPQISRPAPAPQPRPGQRMQPPPPAAPPGPQRPPVPPPPRPGPAPHPGQRQYPAA